MVSFNLMEVSNIIENQMTMMMMIYQFVEYISWETMASKNNVLSSCCVLISTELMSEASISF